MNKKKDNSNLMMTLLKGRTLFVLIILFIFFSIKADSFCTVNSLLLVCKHVAQYGILGIGMTYVIITGGIDLSVGSVVGLVGMIAGGLIAVIFGGNLVVDKACIIAANFGVSQNFIGLTIVAIGTSLPELVTSIVATRKGDSGLALGNAIGSNIFNILFILGMSAAIQPLHVLSESLIDCIILLASGIVLFFFAFTKKTMSRLEGAACKIGRASCRERV